MLAVLIAAVVALLIGLLGTPMFIKLLVRRGYGQFIRDDGPTSHHTKRGTPTMGGAVIILGTLAAYALAHLLTWTQPTVSAILVLFLMSGLGLVGFLVNAALLLATAFVSDIAGFPLRVGDFPPDLLTADTLIAAIVGAVVLSVISTVIRLVVPD